MLNGNSRYPYLALVRPRKLRLDSYTVVRTNLTPIHKDRFDRLIIAPALEYGAERRTTTFRTYGCFKGISIVNSVPLFSSDLKNNLPLWFSVMI